MPGCACRRMATREIAAEYGTVRRFFQVYTMLGSLSSGSSSSPRQRQLTDPGRQGHGQHEVVVLTTPPGFEGLVAAGRDLDAEILQLAHQDRSRRQRPGNLQPACLEEDLQGTDQRLLGHVQVAGASGGFLASRDGHRDKVAGHVIALPIEQHVDDRPAHAGLIDHQYVFYQQGPAQQFTDCGCCCRVRCAQDKTLRVT